MPRPARRFPISRRHWLGQAGALAATGLAGCGRSAGGDSSRQLKVFNWSDYIADSVLPEFETRTGIEVLYDNYSSDAELEARLATGGGAYDLVFPSDRAMHALLAKGLLQEIDQRWLLNFGNLDPQFLSPAFDPGNRFSVPYFWGTVGVGIRTDHVASPVEGFEVLFDDRYRGRITMLSDGENVIACVLAHLGLPLNSVEPAHLARVQELLVRQRPLLQAYTSDAYKERLIAGEAWVALGWSGDLKQAAAEEPRVQVVVPRRGTLLWYDCMAIPKAATNVAAAHAFIDFLLEPEIAARNAEAVQYATPNARARELLPASLRSDASVYPPAETLARCDTLQSRGPAIERIEAVWRQVRG
jgi:spermidine/putrescine-binding protein